MPIFGLSKAFGVGRTSKVFFNLQAGLTRGAVPESWQQHEQSMALNRKVRVIRRLRKQIKDQDENLSQLRSKDREIHRLRKQIKEQRVNLFQLRNELAEHAQGDSSALQVLDQEKGALPDFVVIGAMRCGTSRFYALLTRHPSIKPAAAKELHFFASDQRFDKGIEWYMKCFPPPEWKDGQKTITGEATPKYLNLSFSVGLTLRYHAR